MWGTLQKVGRSLMMPIAVLPAAALLLRFGEHFQKVSWLEWGGFLWRVMEAGGGAVFGNLPLLFAIGVAIGFTGGAGAAALAAGVGYLVLQRINSISVVIAGDGDAVADVTVNMGVLGGILMGLVAAWLYDRYKEVRLPDYLAFFGGRRFVPLITAMSAVPIGLAASVVWPPIGRAIDAGGDWIVGAGILGLFIYGVANRALIPFGLHHILNTLVWFQFGTFTNADGDLIRGDLHRYFEGDPTAGAFMAGWFFIMMFGLPAAAYAMARQADEDQRPATKGILNSAGFTSFLTGVTEPIEFSFLFLAPLLYAVHAVLSGIALVVADLLNITIGFGFSAGLIDYLFLNLGLGSNKLLAIPVGLVFGIVYFLLFTWAIKIFDLPTPGRTPRKAAAGTEAVADANP